MIRLKYFPNIYTAKKLSIKIFLIMFYKDLMFSLKIKPHLITAIKVA